jgi:hypothetical protein
MPWKRSFYIRSRPLQGTGPCLASPVAMTVPGAGPGVALAHIAAIDDPRRFLILVMSATIST